MTTPRKSARRTGAGAPLTATPPSPDPSLDAVHDIYRLLDDNFDALYGACTTDAARAQIRALHASARDAYWKAVADGLRDDNSVVQDIRRDLVDATAQIQQQVVTLQDVTEVIRAMTDAVRLAGALVGLAAIG